MARAGRFGPAESAFREALRLNPHDPAHFAQIAYMLRSRQRARVALHLADEGLRIDPINHDCLNERALALLALGRPEEAGEVITNALGHVPDSAVLHNNLGLMMLQDGEAVPAARELQESLRLDPAQSAAAINLQLARRMASRPVMVLWLRAAAWWRYRRAQVRGVIVGALALAGLVAFPFLFVAGLVLAWSARLDFGETRARAGKAFLFGRRLGIGTSRAVRLAAYLPALALLAAPAIVASAGSQRAATLATDLLLWETVTGLQMAVLLGYVLGTRGRSRGAIAIMVGLAVVGVVAGSPVIGASTATRDATILPIGVVSLIGFRIAAASAKPRRRRD